MNEWTRLACHSRLMLFLPLVALAFHGLRHLKLEVATGSAILLTSLLCLRGLIRRVGLMLRELRNTFAQDYPDQGQLKAERL